MTSHYLTLFRHHGTSEKFQASKWVEKMESDKFRQRVYQIMDDEVIRKFDAREGKAEDFYESNE